MRIERSIEIARPASEVFEFVSDPLNDPSWCPKVRSVKRVDEGSYAVVHRPVPVLPERALSLKVVSADPPKRLVLREDDGTDVFEVTYTLAPAGDGRTRFTQVSDAELGAPRLLHPVIRHGIGRDLARQLRELKRVLEEG